MRQRLALLAVLVLCCLLFLAPCARAQQAYGLYAPYYVVAEGTDTRLVLLNKKAEPLSVGAFALSAAGEELFLGQFDLGLGRHRELSMRELLAGARSDFKAGALRLSYVGEAAALQAWVLVNSRRQAFELQLGAPDPSSTTPVVSFWGGSVLVDSEVTYHFLNAGSRPTNCVFSIGQGKTSSRTLSRSLLPGASQQVRISDDERKGGWITGACGGGDPGSLLGVGIATRGVPIAGFAVIPESGILGPQLEAIRIPLGQAVGRIETLLFNPGDSPIRTRCEILDSATGAILGTASTSVPAWQVATIDVTRALKHIQALPPEVRFRLISDAPGIMAKAVSVLDEGEVVDVGLFGTPGHATGSYPILDTAQYETFVSLVNLGDAPSKIVTQFYWEGGTYSFGPFTIPAGSSYLLEPAALASSGPTDIKRRRLASAQHDGSFRWTVLHGSRSLIARTQARHIGKRDLVGFNCFGCCGQTPWVDIEPNSYVEFYVGETPLFEACVYFNTCSGDMGPYPEYPTSMTVPPPFSWDAIHVGATDASLGTLSFSGEEEKIKPNCQESTVPVFGMGRADTCKTFIIGININQTCSAQRFGCQSCLTCCDLFFAYVRCKGESLDTAISERASCRVNCCTDRCGGNPQADPRCANPYA